MSFGIPFAPGEASSSAGSVDTLFYALLGFTGALGGFLTLLVVPTVYSLIDQVGRVVLRRPAEAVSKAADPAIGD